MVVVYTVLLTVLAVSFAVTVLWPQLILAGIITACIGLVIAMIGTVQILSRKWILWLVVPALALTGLGTVMLAEDLGLSRTSEVTEAVIVDHTVESQTVHDANNPAGRIVYTHEYRLEHTDGTPIDKPMIYRGQGGYEDIDEGDTITVLLDPQGNAPTEPAESIDIGADIGVTVGGLIILAGTYAMCALLLVKDVLRPRRPLDNAAPWLLH